MKTEDFDLRLAFVALFLASPVFAGDADDAMTALLNQCVTPLETAAEVGAGLTRAAPAMEAKLLDGKAAKLLRTDNPRVVVVVHDSGVTCEIMALGMVVSEFDVVFRDWLTAQPDYRVDVGAKMTDEGPGGAYIARKLPEAGYVQAFIQTHPESGFIGITVSRVETSAAADELFGE
ncbi:MAG: hypothetical protein ABI459_10715 [Deltaproteobacteria bacterium]